MDKKERRLIDADMLKEVLEKDNFESLSDRMAVMFAIDIAPTVYLIPGTNQPIPMPLSEWVESPLTIISGNDLECKRCHFQLESKKSQSPFCPYCGAKMLNFQYPIYDVTDKVFKKEGDDNAEVYEEKEK